MSEFAEPYRVLLDLSECSKLTDFKEDVVFITVKAWTISIINDHRESFEHYVKVALDSCSGDVDITTYTDSILPAAVDFYFDFFRFLVRKVELMEPYYACYNFASVDCLIVEIFTINWRRENDTRRKRDGNNTNSRTIH